MTYPVEKTDAEWREQLDDLQYQVARHAATERAFTGKYWDHFQPGHYNCIGCGTPLFEADTKFDAGAAGPATGRRSTARWLNASSTAATAWCAWRCAATAAARTWAMSSPTARSPPASATASTPPPSTSSRTIPGDETLAPPLPAVLAPLAPLT